MDRYGDWWPWWPWSAVGLGIAILIGIAFSVTSVGEQRAFPTPYVTSVETADGTCYLWHNGAGSDMECRWRE